MQVSYSETGVATPLWETLARACTPSGDELLLRRRDGVYEIRCNGWDLMSNRAHSSEEALAHLALQHIDTTSPRILIGGLGMGFTLRAALDASPPDARIEIAELLPEIVAWNRGPLAPLNACALDDPRASVYVGDVADLLEKNAASYDAIMLDVDNGPNAVIYERNATLYSFEGLRMARAALAPMGVLAVWSADRSPAFERLLDDGETSWRVVEPPACAYRAELLHAVYLTQNEVQAAHPYRRRFRAI
jgi:spermidine synthase